MGTTTHAHPARSSAARALYAALFVLAVPASLAVWAYFAAGVVHADPLHLPVLGAALTLIGVVTIVTAMLALWRRGGGLPMNAFPPPRFVSTGIYSLVPHPIYGGFVLACAGVALFAGSAAGLWLVTPPAALGCSALVLGYELPDLRRRFGAPRTSVWLARNEAGPPTTLERLRFYLVVLLPWLAVFELISYLNASPDAPSTYMKFENDLPVLPWLEPAYFSTYVVVLLAPLLIRTARDLRRLTLRALTAIALLFPLYLVLPFFVAPRPFHASGLFAAWLNWERPPIAGACAFPAFHVVWSMLVAAALGQGRRTHKTLWWLWAVLVAVSCVLVGMHSIADILAAFAAYALIVNMPGLWRLVLCGSERLANSWQEWRFGPVRMINHGAYAGAGACVGMLVIQSLIGPGGATLASSICICALVGAALWAQWVEGSPALLRPLGFYGGILGSMIGSLAVVPLHISYFAAITAVAVAAPWIQLLGRLRCLVQGCCHGAVAESVPGIRYTHPRTRVCRLAHLAGIPIHATQLYSILWNVLIGAAMLRLVSLDTPASVLLGIYFLLSGCGRFVEEAWRGEPQTRIVGGLRFYQWIAIVCVVAGAVLTCVRGSAPLKFHVLAPANIALAIAAGVLTLAISGVDFPESTRRFARLT